MANKCPDDECVRLKKRIDIQLRTIDRQSEKIATTNSELARITEFNKDQVGIITKLVCANEKGNEAYQRIFDEKVERCMYIAELEAKIERLSSRGIEDMQDTIATLEAENANLCKSIAAYEPLDRLMKDRDELKAQESEGMEATLSQMLSKEQAERWGLDEHGHKRNTQQIFMRACLAIDDLETKSAADLKQYLDIVDRNAELEAKLLAEYKWVSVEEDGSNLPSDPNEEVFWREPSGHMEKYNSEMFVKREVTHYMRIPPIHLPEAKPEMKNDKPLYGAFESQIKPADDKKVCEWKSSSFNHTTSCGISCPRNLEEDFFTYICPYCGLPIKEVE